MEFMIAASEYANRGELNEKAWERRTKEQDRVLGWEGEATTNDFNSF